MWYCWNDASAGDGVDDAGPCEVSGATVAFRQLNRVHYIRGIQVKNRCIVPVI